MRLTHDRKSTYRNTLRVFHFPFHRRLKNGNHTILSHTSKRNGWNCHNTQQHQNMVHSRQQTEVRMKILSNKLWIRDYVHKHHSKFAVVLSVEDGIERADSVVIFTDTFNTSDPTSKKAVELCKEYPKSYLIIPLSDNNTNFAPTEVDTLYITGQDYFQTPNAISKIHQILNSLLGEYI